MSKKATEDKKEVKITKKTLTDVEKVVKKLMTLLEIYEEYKILTASVLIN